ncbi:TPA: hypothetical protein ACH3X1_012824 [Trebouxia sp. C0004]
MKVSCNLMQLMIAHRLLQRVDVVLQTKSNKLENQALRVALFKVKDAAIMDDDQQLQHLLMCCSPGVMCAMAAALPHIYLASSKVVLPQETLEMDMRGHTYITGDGTFAYIELGEMERQAEYADPVKQLGKALPKGDSAQQKHKICQTMTTPKSSLTAPRSSRIGQCLVQHALKVLYNEGTFSRTLQDSCPWTSAVPVH